MNLIFFEHGGYRDHQGKFPWITLIIIRHGDHGFVVMPCNGDFRGFVKKLGVCFRDVETAKGMCCGDQKYQTYQDRNEE